MVAVDAHAMAGLGIRSERCGYPSFILRVGLKHGARSCLTNGIALECIKGIRGRSIRHAGQLERRHKLRVESALVEFLFSARTDLKHCDRLIPADICQLFDLFRC